MSDASNSSQGPPTNPQKGDDTANQLFPTLPPDLVPHQQPATHQFITPVWAGPTAHSDGPPTVPGYEILEELGRGGMGVVYKARQMNLNRVVALKMVLSGGHAGPELLARFQTEALTIARLDHPNIVRLYEVGVVGGLPYFSLEFCDGGSLASHLRGAPQPAREAAEMVEVLARAVHFAHQSGVIHRDLKPGNVLVTGAGKERVAKVTDFGLAKSIAEAIPDQGSAAGGFVTGTGNILGTPSYMAPEQALGRKVGPLADVYALGAILYEMLSGRPPFHAETAFDTLRQVAEDEPVPFGRMNLRVPRELETICLVCLRKEPHRRYPTALELADDLRRFLSHEPIRARPAGLVERGVKWAWRHPAAAVMIVAAVLGALGLLAGGLVHEAQLREERNRAEASFEDALAAVEALLTEVAVVDLDQEPRMEATRVALMEKALRFYQQFLEKRGHDPSVRRQAAKGYKGAGDISRLLERPEEAKADYAKAITLLGGLAQEFPDDAQWQADLAYCHNFLGEVLRESSRTEPAEREYAEAIRIQTGLVDRFPVNPAYEQDLARTLYNRGILARQTGRLPEAEQDFMRAVARLQTALAKRDTPDCRQDLARAHLNLGTALADQNRPGKAVEEYSKARELLVELSDAFPGNPAYRRELAVVDNNFGNITYSHDLAAAEEHHRKAVRRLRELVHEYPRVPVNRQELANTLNSLGTVLWLRDKKPQAKEAMGEGRDLLIQLVRERPKKAAFQGDLAIAEASLGWWHLQAKEWDDARPHFESAITRLHEALKPNPNNPDYIRAQRDATQNLAETLVNLHDHPAAERTALDLAAYPDESGDNRYLAARFLARSLRDVRKDNSLTEEARRATAERYEDEILGCLREAIRQRYPVARKVREDAEQGFSAMEDHPEFKQLLIQDGGN